MEASPDAVDNDSPWRRVAERFANLRPAGGPIFFETVAKQLADLEHHPVLPVYFEYAVTANERGRRAVKDLGRLVPVRRRGLFRRRMRVLDVGCAYGGFLVAFAEMGARVTGIDFNEPLLRLAAVNLREQGRDADLVLGDALEAHPSFQGRFDLILANDVLEHVPAPEVLLRNLRAWLSDDGAAYLQIPNGQWAPYVEKDGHHQLFGVTLLDFDEASAYLRLLGRRESYSTYNYLDVAGYERLFAGCGLSFELQPEPTGMVSVESVLAQCATLRANFGSGLATVPESYREIVRERVEAYLERVFRAPRTTPREIEKFLVDYGPCFWTILARRV